MGKVLVLVGGPDYSNMSLACVNHDVADDDVSPVCRRAVQTVTKTACVLVKWFFPM